MRAIRGRRTRWRRLPRSAIEDGVAGAMVDQEMAALSPRDDGDSDPLGELQAHVGDARAGQEYRDPHLSDLHDDLRGETARGVEEHVPTCHSVQPHVAGDNIRHVVATYVLHEPQDLRAPAQGATVNGTGPPIDFIVPADVFQYPE